MTDAIEKPLVLTGKPLLEALDFSVEGPELSRGPMELRFSQSAATAEVGMRLKIMDLAGGIPPRDAIDISGTYPPVARLSRAGRWYSTGGEVDWEGLVSMGTDRLATAETFALLLNACDHPRDLYGMVWGPVRHIRELAGDQQRRAVALTGMTPKSPFLWSGTTA